MILHPKSIIGSICLKTMLKDVKHHAKQNHLGYNNLINPRSWCSSMFLSPNDPKWHGKTFQRTDPSKVRQPRRAQSVESGEKYKVQQIPEAESAKMGHRRVVSFGNTGQKEYRAINIRKVTCHERENKGNCKVSRANSHGPGHASANGLAHVSSRFKQQKRSSLLQLQSKMTTTCGNDRTSREKNQRSKFIKQLQSKVLKSQNESYAESVLGQESNRYWETGKKSADREKSREKSRDKSRDSAIQIEVRESKMTRPRLDSSPALIKIQSIEEETCEKDIDKDKDKDKDREKSKEKEKEVPMRSRSKTFVRDFSKIVQDNLFNQQKTPNFSNDHSKTIELNQLSTKLKLTHSLDQIQKWQKMKLSPGNTSKNFNFNSRSNSNLNTVRLELAMAETSLNHHYSQNQQEQNESSSSGGSSEPSEVDKKELYQKEMNHITKDFIKECDKMNSTKSQLYDRLRNKLVDQYPKMRKRYQEYSLPEESDKFLLEKSSEENLENLMGSGSRGSGIRSSFGVSNMHMRSESSECNAGYLTHTQVRQRGRKQEEGKDKRMLKDIFKQAYIWSHAKGKTLNEKYQKSCENAVEMRQLRSIQKNLTFMKYMNKRSWKKNLNRDKIKGANLFKNKDAILELEREGSPQQGFLKKCLDDAIESCIRGGR